MDSAPPSPRVFDYPATVALALAFVFTSLILFVSGRFDPTGGVLTISILVVGAFIATAVFVLLFTVPSDEITSGVIGGLIAAFGAVVAYWLSKRKE